MSIKNIFQILISDSDEKIDPPNKESINLFFSGYKHVVYSASEISEIMIANGDIDIEEAFRGFRPYSYKADIGRYYLLYKYGGWYSDLNNRFLQEPPNVDGIEFLAFHDIPGHTPAPWAFQTSILYAEPGAKQLEYTLSTAVSYYNEKKYGKNALEPTGPIALGKCIAQVGVDEEKYYFGFFRDSSDGIKQFILKDGTVLANYKDSGLNPGNPGIPGANNYIEMWNNRDVYE